MRALGIGILAAGRPLRTRSFGLIALALAALCLFARGDTSSLAASVDSAALVAAYSFDEGAGTTVGDSSGKGNGGTIAGATWTAAGKYGAALSFDGVNDWVTVADSDSLDLASGMTLEAWVKPSTVTSWRTVGLKEASGTLAYALYAGQTTSVPTTEIVTGATVRRAVGTAALPLNAWSHLAATFDGAALKLYVNGTLVRTVAVTGSMAASTGPLRIGGNGIWSEWFQGQIDEMRIYNRALTEAEIQTDMNSSVGVPDTMPPTAPEALAGVGSLSSVALSWQASTDDVGVARYNLHRSTTAGFTPAAANRVAQPTGTTYTDSGLAAGTYYYKVTAEDAAGNVSGPSDEASAVVTGDTTAPTAPASLTASAGAGSATLAWGASTDDAGVARYNVHRSTSGGFTPSAANRVAQPTGTTHTDSGLAAGTYYYKVTAEDAAGNVSQASNEASAAVATAPPSGLVAAFGFDENSGTTVGDTSGRGNNGAIAGATWTAAGKYGAALSFDGVNDWVTVPDGASLDLTSGMTLEAWVRPSVVTSWRTVLFKEQTGNLVYGIYANTNTNRPSANVFVAGADRNVRGSAQLASNAWTHLAATYGDGNLRLYVNGTQAAVLARTGDITTSAGVLRIGGNGVWPEWFQGLIDEVRVYNRVLSPAEIQTDMNSSVGLPDTTAPSAPADFVKTGATETSIATSWTASTDNVGVTDYRLYRDGVFVGTTNGTTFSFPGLTCGTSYTLGVEAVDGANNVSGRALLTTSTDPCDTTPPSPPGSLTASGSLSSVALSWTASVDDRAVTRYNVHRSTSPGFTPSAANRIAQPTGTSYTDSGLAAGTYHYQVTAEDAAGNVSQPSSEAAGTVTGDTSAPTAPGSLTATGSVSSVSLAWTASTDNVGVSRYNVHRSTTPGFTPSATNLVAQPTGTSHTDSGLSPGTYYYRVTAEDAAGNVSEQSTEASGTVTGDLTPPGAPSNLVATAGANSVGLTWTGSTDDVGVSRYNVHRSTSAGFTPSAANRIAQPIVTTYTDSGLAAGTYYYRVTAEDAAGNVSAPSDEAGATVANAPPGLVAAYSFDVGQGATLADLSGNGNHGTIAGATWTTAGKFSSALSFDGANDWVTVPDAASLDLTSAMTLEAWVRPTAVTSWRTVLFKEQAGNLAYGIYANTNTNRPSANVFVAGADRNARGSAQLVVNTWTHLAATYDGTTLKLYVDGAQAASLAQTGSITTSTGVLRLGGNNIWPEWFAGLMDEVRVYDRALTQAQIQADMNQSVGTPDTIPPSAPADLAATGAVGSASLTWTAAADNVGIDRYSVHRSTSPGFTPSDANRVAQPTGTGYVDSGRPAGTYYYRVTAHDVAGNVSPASNEAAATVLADTTPPTVSVTGPPPGATVFDTITVSATASDDDAVAGVQFKLDGADLGAEDTAAPYSIQWNTRTAVNGPHSLTAVARDATGNTAAAAGADVTVDNTLAPPPGLVAGYGFDEKSGTTTADASPNGNTGTISGATRVDIGRFGSTLAFDGLNDWVTVPDAPSLDLTSAMTLSAWVKPTALTGWRSVIFKEQAGNHVYVLYANRNTNVPNGEADLGSITAVNGTSQLPLNTWTHVAFTYDGSALRLYANGALAATAAASGSIRNSTGVLRIGGNSIWPEWFPGQIDEVRIYSRALSAAEIQGDMVVGVARDTRAPEVRSTSPAAGAGDVSVAARITASFDEAMSPASLTTTTFELRDAGGALVPATVSYDAGTGTATLAPADVLRVGTAYTARLKGGTSGARVTDLAGNALTADHTWSFTTEPAPPPILVLTSTTNGFTKYVPEILRAEGLNAFSVADVSLVSPGLLGLFDVVVLGETPLSSSQVTTLTSWVSSGGNLIAFRPDKQLAGLLGLSDAGSTLANGYVLVNTSSAPGSGIVGQTIQYHGAADRYTLNGATAVATLYSTATAATSNPALTLRSVGPSGGEAAAFTYDLARSLVLTRQGNPAWVGQDRDGINPIRPNDLFFGARTGDVQPDWVNVSKIGIPQADEQQRLLANLIEHVNRDRQPIPRFWYLPRGEKAAVVMTGDDHAEGGTAGHFDRYKALSPSGCSVADWECVRSTSYIYPSSPLTNAQAAGYVADGFEVAVHTQISGGCSNWTPSQLDSLFASQRASFASKYTSVPAPVTERTHCVAWSDWASHAKVDLAYGVRLDTNYYHYPASWIGSTPGYMTGSGLVMRFADVDGTPIDVYQAHTHMTDEGGQAYPVTVDALLDKALGPEGYYGVLTANMHTDFAPHADAERIVASAQARSVPIVSSRQMLTWVDGRNASAFKSFSWSGGRLDFTVTAGAGANGLQAMLPTQSSGGSLASLSRGGSAVSYSTQTIKGVEYAVFSATAGAYTAIYSP